MINQVYQLVSPRQFEATFKTIDLHNHNSKVIVRPLYLSICAADLRYYCEIEIAKFYLRNYLCH